METMQTWFGLKDAHVDFTIANDTDAGLFFVRHELNETLHSILRRSFRTGNPPKFVLFGDWGVGKTHTMRHVQYVIEHTAEFKARVVFVELPDISSKSRFEVAHGALLDALSFDVARLWVQEYQRKHGQKAQENVREFTQSGDVAIAFGNLGAFGDNSRIAWDWLRGIELSSNESRNAGLPSSVTQSGQLVRILQMFGRICRDVEDNFLVLMLDEATKLSSISNQDAINHWLNAFKTLADDQTKEVGFIVSGSWNDPDDMALPLQDPQVRSRFGEHNYIRLPTLSPDETETFIKALLSEWIDPNRRQDLYSEFLSESDEEEISDDTFPFTGEGIVSAAKYATRNGGYTTPRDIQKTLDDFANRAIDDKRHIISSTYLMSLINGT
jgi:Cdc6-like AAA superfamily ATPase